MLHPERNKKANMAIQMFEAWCNENNVEHANVGYECLHSTKEFMKRIKKLQDKTSKMVRYFPDKICANTKTIYVEIKYGSSIEKDAYDTYMQLYELGYDIAIVFYTRSTYEEYFQDGLLMFTKIENLKMKHLGETYRDVPVKDNCWVTPRLMDEKEYCEWKEKTGGSGTTYAYIDESRSNFIELPLTDEQRSKHLDTWQRGKSLSQQVNHNSSHKTNETPKKTFKPDRDEYNKKILSKTDSNGDHETNGWIPPPYFKMFGKPTVYEVIKRPPNGGGETNIIYHISVNGDIKEITHEYLYKVYRKGDMQWCNKNGKNYPAIQGTLF